MNLIIQKACRLFSRIISPRLNLNPLELDRWFQGSFVSSRLESQITVWHRSRNLWASGIVCGLRPLKRKAMKSSMPWSTILVQVIFPWIRWAITFFTVADHHPQHYHSWRLGRIDTVHGRALSWIVYEKAHVLSVQHYWSAVIVTINISMVMINT